MRRKQRKICIVTTSRADYGLLYWLMKEIDNDRDLVLQVIASGTHLEPEFGNTYKWIEQDGFRIDRKIYLSMTDDSVQGAARSLGIGFSAFARAYDELKPNIVVILGDRYELIPAVVTAVLADIPLAHIHGGEVTEGAVDELIRHAVTKLSCFHFASSETYCKRIVQMGEHPNRVFWFGAPGIDNMYKLNLLSKKELERTLSFTLKKPCALVTFHPVTLEKGAVRIQIKTVLAAIEELKLNAVFTMANADYGGRIINREIKAFCRKKSKQFLFVKNLGQLCYLSCMKHCNLVIGNSSSGIIESTSLWTPVIDIGNRQEGRVRGANIIHADCSRKAIVTAVKRGLSSRFTNRIHNAANPYDRYGDGQVSVRIKDTLKHVSLDRILLKKRFFDLPYDFSRTAKIKTEKEKK